MAQSQNWYLRLKMSKFKLCVPVTAHPQNFFLLISANERSFLLIDQIKNLCMIFDFFSYSNTFQPINQQILPVRPSVHIKNLFLFSTVTVTTLVRAAIVSHLDFCSDHSQFISLHPGPLQDILNRFKVIVFKIVASYHFSPQNPSGSLTLSKFQSPYSGPRGPR